MGDAGEVRDAVIGAGAACRAAGRDAGGGHSDCVVGGAPAGCGAAAPWLSWLPAWVRPAGKTLWLKEDPSPHPKARATTGKGAPMGVGCSRLVGRLASSHGISSSFPGRRADLHHLHRVTSILSMRLFPTYSQWISVHPPNRVFSHIPIGLSSSCLWDYLHPPHNTVSILPMTELHHLHGVSSIPSQWDYVCPPHKIFSILPIELNPHFP